MTLRKDYKEFFEREFELEYHDTIAIREQINDLITAYENQNELSLALGNVDKLNATLEVVQHKLRSCKSLAKLERENLLERNTDLTEMRKTQQKTHEMDLEVILDLTAKLASVRDENRRLRDGVIEAYLERKNG